ncbi:penicillin-binding protein 1C [Jiella sp. MQZ9-1]|uniref:peptidoglycan glycosyltransferase n=1 Tax=Jiella flava TaxID=2816857 RepID=A0A939JSZ2_9HYPH|nr:penicillin-binding protein 1C [Jiella flava]MBO0661595.1 penicillin-binding protein 1C [Jiella flava]MCD2470238.1 penicillin-binding protein 1C [Jiella flava]
MSPRRRLAQLGILIGMMLLIAGLWGYSAIEQAVARRVTMLSQPPVGVEVVDREGRLLRAFPVSDGRWRLAADGHDVDPRFVKMLLTWEDKRFFSHHGIDPQALLRAAWQSLSYGRIVSGGSTLTMQVARMLNQLPTGSFAAKIEQILTALALERRYDKAEILALYLRLAPYGGNVEGIRAASLVLFGKEPRQLTAAEAALLVALPQSPERYRPDRFPKRAKAARDRVLKRMASRGVIDAGQEHRALAEPIPGRRLAMPTLAPHLADRLHRADPTRAHIAVTIDKTLQTRLETYALTKAKSLTSPLSLAIVVADSITGEIIADIGSPDYFDRRRQGFVDLTEAPRSPGSTLKPLIYGLAFERGIAHPESLIDDAPAGFAGYTPQNFDHQFDGVITARRALQLSRNLPAVELLSAVGPSRLVERMRRAGATPKLGDRSLPGLAIGLGGLGMTLEDLVRIYAGIANGGLSIPLHVDADAPRSTPRRILSRQAAWYVTSILSGATSTTKGSPGLIAHKTGTSYGYRDAWTIGYDGRDVVGVWLGRPDGAPVPGLIGQDMAVPVMRDVFSRIGPRRRLPGPPSGILALSGAGLPPPLQRIGRAAERLETGLTPEIVYPPDKSRIALGDDAGGMAPLYLKVRNGRPPFTWYVDGVPVDRDQLLRQSTFQPTEPGFLSISVVDGRGAAARTNVFVK